MSAVGVNVGEEGVSVDETGIVGNIGNVDAYAVAEGANV